MNQKNFIVRTFSCVLVASLLFIFFFIDGVIFLTSDGKEISKDDFTILRKKSELIKNMLHDCQSSSSDEVTLDVSSQTVKVIVTGLRSLSIKELEDLLGTLSICEMRDLLYAAHYLQIPETFIDLVIKKWCFSQGPQAFEQGVIIENPYLINALMKHLNTAIMWNLIDQNKSYTMKEEYEDDYFYSILQWMPSGSSLAASNAQGRVVVLNADKDSSGLVVAFISPALITPIYSMSLGPKGERIAIATNGRLCIWDIQSNQLLSPCEGNVDPLIAVSWGNQGKWLASVSSKSVIYVWDVNTGKLVKALRSSGMKVDLVHLDTFGTLISGSRNGYINIWSLQNGKKIRLMKAHSARITSLASSPDGENIASASKDKTVHIWHPASNKSVSLLGHLNDVNAVAWHRDSRFLASGSCDSTIRIWDIRTLRQIKVVKDHQQAHIRSLSWSSDGSSLAFVCNSGVYSTINTCDLMGVLGKYVKGSENYYKKLFLALCLQKAKQHSTFDVTSNERFLRLFNEFPLEEQATLVQLSDLRIPLLARLKIMNHAVWN